MKSSDVRYGVRSSMVAFWLIAIAFLLYIPYALRIFPQPKSLNVLVWPTMLDAQRLAEFEKRTGIKLFITYYESNEELVRKMQLTKGAGYDLLIASDSSVDEFIRGEMLQKIDRSRVPFFAQLYPPLLGHYYDEQNDYSLPYYLGVYGLGIDTDYFGKNLPAASWKLIFEQQPYKVTMTDDPRRALLLAGRYLFGTLENLRAHDRMQAIADLLIKQKKWVELYSDIRGEEVLASKSCPVALTINSDLWRMKREYPNLEFLLPDDGFMVIDSFVIPAATDKQDLIYQLLNFIYEPDVVKYHATKYGFCPPRLDVDVAGFGLFCPTAEQMKKLEFFRNILPKNQIDDVWVSVMAE